MADMKSNLYSNSKPNQVSRQTFFPSAGLLRLLRGRGAGLALVIFPAACLVVFLTACGGGNDADSSGAGSGDGSAGPASTEIVVYSGRSQDLIAPILDRFEAETGIDVKADYSSTGPLAIRLMQEGDLTFADVFIAQDAGALGQLEAAGVLRTLDADWISEFGLLPVYQRNDAKWLPLSGRARTLAYSTARLAADDLPTSVFDLTDPIYRSRVGWAPTNASFQSFVTALRVKHGDAEARAWLEAMVANDAKPFSNNRGILDGIAAGEVDLGLPNHYYLLGKIQSDPDFPVAQAFFADGDVGNLINVAGIGIVEGAAHADAAEKLIAYLLSAEAQTYFVEETNEYPVVAGAPEPQAAVDGRSLESAAPSVDLNGLADLEATRKMLVEVGLLEP